MPKAKKTTPSTTAPERAGYGASKKDIPVKIQKEENDFFAPAEEMENEGEMFNGEGQLSCDVYQDNDNVVIKSTIAGVDPKNLDISVSNDLLTIRGFREAEDKIAEDDYYYQECYWGTFSRSIVLPHEIDSNKTQASIKNGILTIILPKKYKSTSIKVKSLDE